MENYFPADVSLRVNGEIGEAQKLFPAARQLFFRANKMRLTGSPVVRLWQPGEDGSLLFVYLVGNIKIIYVQPAIGVVETPEEEVPVLETFAPFACPNMLNGLVVPGEGVLQLNDAGFTKTNPDGTDDYAIHEFHPTAASASVYELNFAWQDVDRLGLEADSSLDAAAMQVRWPKPAMYSGAMKRIVAALYGIGKTEDYGPGQISDDAYEDAPYYAAQNHYDYRWERTDGIHKVDGAYWLIRIAKDDGVLAMPLPLFDCTTGTAFANALADIGDIDTYSIVAEFGGLPTGETFPEDLPDAVPPTTALTAAIASGAVLRLMSAEDLLPFYEHHVLDQPTIVKEGYFDACGWAFSNSGEATSAHNTCWWYSRPDIALHTDYFNDGWVKDGNQGASPFDRYMRTEHWRVVFDIPHAVAELELVNTQPVEAPNHGIGSADEKFTLNFDGLDAEEMYGRRMAGGGAPPDHAHELSMPVFRTGHHDWITGVNEYEVDEAYEDAPGHTTHNVTGLGCLMASGFNPLTFEAHQTRDVYSGGPVVNTLTFWCHSAMMLVPSRTAFQDTDSEKLERVTFWGRSQANIKLRNMEASRAAPVHVFYNGEDLEIVYREAERFNTDLSGAFQAGDFWATSMDLRQKVLSQPRYLSSIGPTPTVRALQTILKIGLIIPSGVREGYAFMQYMFGPDEAELTDPAARAVFNPHPDNDSIKWYLFVAGLGVKECALQYHQPRRGDDAPDVTYTLSGDSYNYSELGVLRWMWWWQWTSEFYGLGSTSNVYQSLPRHSSKSKGVSWGVSVSAINPLYYTTDGPELGFNPWDYPWWYFWEGALGRFIVDQIPPPAPIFVWELPAGIHITYERDAMFNEHVQPRPTDVTFVGGA